MLFQKGEGFCSPASDFRACNEEVDLGMRLVGLDMCPPKSVTLLLAAALSDGLAAALARGELVLPPNTKGDVLFEGSPAGVWRKLKSNADCVCRKL